MCFALCVRATYGSSQPAFIVARHVSWAAPRDTFAAMP